MRHATVMVIVAWVALGVLSQCAPNEPKMAQPSAQSDDHGLAVMKKAESSLEASAARGVVAIRFREQRDAVLQEMKDYRSAAPHEAMYKTSDIERCAELIDRYLFALDHLPDTGKQEFIQSQVKSFILCLNDLNERCESRLIETSEREQLAEIIQEAALHAGLVTDEADITEKWRAW